MDETGSAGSPEFDSQPRSFVSRILLTFAAPGALGDDLRGHPTWFLPTVLGALLMTGSLILIPPDVWQEFMREQMLASGQPVPANGFPISGETMRVIYGVIFPIVYLVMLLIVAALMTFSFAFILGDEIKFRSALSAVAFSGVIYSLGTLLVAPLRVAQGNLELTLGIGTFVEGSLDPGFLLYFLRSLDFFLLWAAFLFAVLVSRIVPKRTLASALVVVGVWLVGFLSFMAWVRARALG